MWGAVPVVDVFVLGYCANVIQNASIEINIACNESQYFGFTCGYYHENIYIDQANDLVDTCQNARAIAGDLNSRCGNLSPCTIYSNSWYDTNPNCQGRTFALEYDYGCLDDWSSWSWTCPTDCRGENITMTRTCEDPHGCVSGEQNSTIGNCTELGCPAEGVWSEWGSWSSCPESCTSESLVRTRSCDAPSGWSGDFQCPTGDASETVDCLVHGCPRNGVWSDWSSWSACPESCVGQTLERNRTCDDPSPANNGSDCQGNITETAQCGVLACPTHGEWGTWKAWSGCPSVCIDEMVERNRSCDNPTPDNGGNNCTGNTSELRDCNAHGCPGIDNQSDVPTYYYIGGGVAACFLLTAIVLAAIYKAKQLSHSRRHKLHVKPCTPTKARV